MRRLSLRVHYNIANVVYGPVDEVVRRYPATNTVYAVLYAKLNVFEHLKGPFPFPQEPARGSLTFSRFAPIRASQ